MEPLGTEPPHPEDQTKSKKLKLLSDVDFVLQANTELHLPQMVFLARYIQDNYHPPFPVLGAN